MLTRLKLDQLDEGLMRTVIKITQYTEERVSNATNVTVVTSKIYFFHQ